MQQEIKRGMIFQARKEGKMVLVWVAKGDEKKVADDAFEVIELNTHMKMKKRMKPYLLHRCQFDTLIKFGVLHSFIRQES